MGYVLDRNSGLYFLNLTNPTAPQFIARSTGTSASATTLALSRGYAYVVDGLLQYLQVYDVNHPTNAARIAWPGIGGGSAVHISAFVEPGRDLLYLGGSAGYFRVIDIKTPSNPHEISSYNNGPPVHAICVADNYAYLALDSAGLCVFNVTSPTTKPILWYQSRCFPRSRFRRPWEWRYAIRTFTWRVARTDSEWSIVLARRRFCPEPPRRDPPRM